MPTTAIEIIERHARAGTWWYDPDSSELWWSPGIYRLYGLDPERHRPTLQQALSYLTPESQAHVQAAIEHALATGQGWNLLLQMQRSDGVLRHMQGIGSAEPRAGHAPLLAGAFFDVHDETERRQNQRRLEQQLAEQALRWQTASESAGLSLIDLDLDTDQISLSGVLARRLGLTSEQKARLDHAAWYQLMHDADRAARRHKLAAHTDGRSALFDCEYRLCLPEQRMIWVREAGKAWHEDGRVRVIGTLTDIDARKQAERALKQSQRRLQQTLRNAPIGIALVSPEGRWLTVNQAMCEMIGYSETELLALTFQDVTHPDDLADDLARAEGLLAGHTLGYRLEKRYLHKAGHAVDIQLDVSLLRDETGQPLYFIAQVQDISERRREHRELFEAHELANITFEAIGEGVIRIDRHGIIQQANTAACDLLGEARNSLLHHRFIDRITFYHPDDGQPIEHPLPAVLEYGGCAQVPLFTRLCRRDGSLIPIADSLSAIRAENGEIRGAVFVFQDISEARRHTEELIHQASHDTLTGLPNRRGFQQGLTATWQRVRSGMLRAFVMYLDLDHFKAVNDNCGHAAGDELLFRVASNLRGLLRDSDVLARLGGDEFAAIVHAREAEGARVVADKFIRSIQALEFVYDGRTYRVGLSVGIAALDAALDAPEASLAQADSALYAAKEAGRNCYRLFQNSDRAESAAAPPDDAELLRRGLDNDGFRLYLQPIVDCDSRPIGHEALLRAVSSDGSDVVPASAFLPAAKRLGLTPEIDLWVVERALELLDSPTSGLAESAYLSVNLNPFSLADARFHAVLLSRLDANPQHAGRLVFEIAESDALFGAQYPELIDQIRTRGFEVWLDDFASSYQGFDLLKRVHVDGIKIDGAFIHSLDQDTINRAVLRAIVDVARSHDLTMIAEGVETETSFALLAKAGIARFQGFYFQPPAPNPTRCAGAIHGANRG
ncbi:EAL domain-containing protein [Salinisphaera sp. SPP-AMP-43]|uniref:bifunctional diguanylate cyclase/phosphodiesterase n=1 Tax=Salinisphaera sp. SPP-AMP-43 TaxID=3121288 RepID=UPI003C6DD03E